MKQKGLLSAGYAFDINCSLFTIDVNVVEMEEVDFHQASPFKFTLPTDSDFAKEEGIDMEIFLNGDSPFIEQVYGNLDIEGQEYFCKTLSAFACLQFAGFKDQNGQIRDIEGFKKICDKINQDIGLIFCKLKDTLHHAR